jgi:hypothetical protein
MEAREGVGMSWARYDDALSMNRKVAELRALGPPGIAAIGLHLLANTWSRNQGTGGFIATHMPDQLAGRGGLKLAQLLAKVTMFDAAEGGWMIHDFDEYNDPTDLDPHRSADERRKEISAIRAAAGAKGGRQTASKRVAELPAKAPANGQQRSSPGPDPDPVPEEPDDDDNSRGLPPAAVVVVELYVEYSKATSTNGKARNGKYADGIRNNCVNEHGTEIVAAVAAGQRTEQVLEQLFGITSGDLMRYTKWEPT